MHAARTNLQILENQHMTKLTGIILTSALAVLSTGALADGDVAAGKAKFAMCQGCHGANGVSTNPANPSIAGKDAAFIKEQLVAFKSGKRDNATMKAMTAGLKDADIDNLAAYVATLKP
jgi:cytochrome c553